MTEAPASPLDWTEDGHPRSRLFGDIYFSPEDGLAESRTVFLPGCGLPEAWAGRRQFVVGELGFGAGLNILALLDLWRRHRPPGGRLSIFSVEGYPVRAEEMLRAVARWEEIANLAALLAARWPGQARGFHRVDLPELSAQLDLAVLPVEAALAEWDGLADAWFLDGFSPALNPDMWREEILAAVARRSAPGARAATFTVAGAVRRGLQAAGFAIDKRPGYGRKRERLEARLPGKAAEPPRPRVAVVGAGIAGASAARALRALGIAPALLEARRPAAGASGNPAGLVTPRLDAGGGEVARLSAQAFARAVQLFEAEPDLVIARGVLQLAGGERDPARFQAICDSGLFEPDALSVLTPEAASKRLGSPAPVALDMACALVVEPAAAVAHWAGDWREAAVAEALRSGDHWVLNDAAGNELWRGEALIIAAGPQSADLVDGIELTPVRGQASWTPDSIRPAAAAWGGYVVPTRDGFLFGATHDRGDADAAIRPGDDRRNLETLAAARPDLAGRVDPVALNARASVRATTGDRLPVAGEAAPGLWLLTGFGSRGLSFAPLLAEHVAARIAGAPSPLPASLAATVDPARFARRAARRGRNSVADGAQAGRTQTLRGADR